MRVRVNEVLLYITSSFELRTVCCFTHISVIRCGSQMLADDKTSFAFHRLSQTPTGTNCLYILQLEQLILYKCMESDDHLKHTADCCTVGRSS